MEKVDQYCLHSTQVYPLQRVLPLLDYHYMETTQASAGSTPQAAGTAGVDEAGGKLCSKYSIGGRCTCGPDCMVSEIISMMRVTRGARTAAEECGCAFTAPCFLCMQCGSSCTCSGCPGREQAHRVMQSETGHVASPGTQAGLAAHAHTLEAREGRD